MGRWWRTPSSKPSWTAFATSRMYALPSPRYMSSRMPITSAMNEIMLAVSRTVSPCAIWDFPSSRSARPRPSAWTAEAKLNRVRVELSRKIDMASPESKTRSGRPARCSSERISATSASARISASGFSQVSRKSLP